MEDIEVDGEGQPQMRRFRSDISKKLTVEEQADSGLESMGYYSADLASLSLNAVDIKQKPEEECVDSSTHLASLENSMSKLIISNSGCKDSDRFDSGLENDLKLECTELATTESCWVSPQISQEQIMVIFQEDEDGDNQLHMSIIHEIPEFTMQIIGLVPSCDWLNDTNNLQQTPLHIAVLTRQVSVVRRLVCAGASVTLQDLNGNTPLHNACFLGYEDVVCSLLKPVRYEETLQNRYKIPHQRIPQDLECRNYEGLTCLHLAALGGHIGVMQILLSAGANVNASEGKSGRTVLHLAAEWGNTNIVSFLLSQKNIDLNAKTYAGQTPLLLALGRKHSHVVAELVNSGALADVWSLSEDSDEISDEELVGELTSSRPAVAHRVHHHS